MAPRKPVNVDDMDFEDDIEIEETSKIVKPKAEKAVWRMPVQTTIDEIIGKPILEQVEHVKFDVEIEFTEPMLGTIPKNKDVFSTYIASKNLSKTDLSAEQIEKIIEEESDTVDESLEASPGHTGFHKDEEGIFIYNYMILGNIKANIKSLMDSNSIKKISSFKKACDTKVTVSPRKLRFYWDNKQVEIPNGFAEDKDGLFIMKEALYTLERSLRTSGPSGERVTVVKADLVNPGTKLNFQIILQRNAFGLTPEALAKAIMMGSLQGLGQWRGSGKYGTFKVNKCKLV